MKRVRKEELETKWKKLVTKAVTDDVFKVQLRDDPIKHMNEYELEVPEGVEVRVGVNNIITLIEPKEAPDALKEEVKWWRVRLDMIQEFGQDERGVKQAGSPDGTDEDV